jgi:hypothetical protein
VARGPGAIANDGLLRDARVICCLVAFLNPFAFFNILGYEKVSRKRTTAVP